MFKKLFINQSFDIKRNDLIRIFISQAVFLAVVSMVFMNPLKPVNMQESLFALFIVIVLPIFAISLWFISAWKLERKIRLITPFNWNQIGIKNTNSALYRFTLIVLSISNLGIIVALCINFDVIVAYVCTSIFVGLFFSFIQESSSLLKPISSVYSFVYDGKTVRGHFSTWIKLDDIPKGYNIIAITDINEYFKTLSTEEKFQCNPFLIQVDEKNKCFFEIDAVNNAPKVNKKNETSISKLNLCSIVLMMFIFGLNILFIHNIWIDFTYILFALCKLVPTFKLRSSVINERFRIRDDAYSSIVVLMLISYIGVKYLEINKMFNVISFLTSSIQNFFNWFLKFINLNIFEITIAILCILALIVSMLSFIRTMLYSDEEVFDDK